MSNIETDVEVLKARLLNYEQDLLETHVAVTQSIPRAINELEKNIANFQGHLDGAIKVFGVVQDGYDKRYAPRTEFDNVKKLVYGAVGFILLAFLGGITYMVFTKDAQNSKIGTNNVGGQQ